MKKNKWKNIIDTKYVNFKVKNPRKNKKGETLVDASKLTVKDDKGVPRIFIGFDPEQNVKF